MSPPIPGWFHSWQRPTWRRSRYVPEGCPSLPVATSQSLIVLSSPADASVLPSGVMATHQTISVCPLRVNRTFPVLTSQSFTVRSSLPDARVLPSDAIASEQTLPSCPVKVASSLAVATSQSLMVLSGGAEIKVLPSGSKARELLPPGHGRVANSLAVRTSQSFTETSSPVARVLPSGEKATDKPGRILLRVARSLMIGVRLAAPFMEESPSSGLGVSCFFALFCSSACER